MNFHLLRLKLSRFSKSPSAKIIAIVIFIFFLIINLVALSQKLFYSPSGPNVLLIIADALRTDHLGCYGYSRPTSPQIDKFAAKALIFEKAMSNAPWTKPSVGSILTSLYPNEHKAFYWSENLDNGFLTLAEVFRNLNYTTIAVQSNEILTKAHNFNQGFQYYEEMLQQSGEKITEKFNTLLARNKKKKFFAYLHYMDTHLPYDASDKFISIFETETIHSSLTDSMKANEIRMLNEMGLSPEDKQHLINMYDAEIRNIDYNFEKIIDNLKKLGILDKTIIILTSDHGEEFWEHGGLEHGHSLYNELLHVPLVIKYDSLLPTKRISTYVHLLDLFPTILSLAGIENDFDLSGKDLTPIISKNSPINTELFFEGILYGAEKKAVLKDGWKLIENTGIKNKDTFDLLGSITKYKYPEYNRGFELYNINKDFYEKFNLVDENPLITNKLKGHLRLFKMTSLDDQKTKRNNLKKKLDDLRSLGYIK